MTAQSIESAELAPDHRLHVPQATLPRQHVMRRMQEAASYPIVIVIAPAGFGKSTAIRHFLAHRENVIYLNTPQATTLEQFIHAFARACSKQLPDMGSPPVDTTDGTADLEGTLDLQVAWANTHLRNARCTIAIDDLQRADATPSVAMFLGRLASNIREGVQWIFASRKRTNLPVAQWQGYGYADAVVTADDLRMTIEDAKEISALLKAPATEEQLSLLVELTRGFSVPLTYAIRLSARRGSIAGLVEGTRSFTFDFLAEQLWASLSAEECRLLEVAVFLPAIHIHDYESAGYSNASSILSRLCDDIAFLGLSATGIFSMHDLFREFVMLQISLSGPERKQSRHDAAVTILMLSERYNEGFELLLEGRNSQKLLDAIEQFASKLTDVSLIHRVITATEEISCTQFGLETLHFHTEHSSWFGELHKSQLFAEEIIRRPGATSKHLLCALRSIYRVADGQRPEEQQEWLARMPDILNRMTEIDRSEAYACQASLLARFSETGEQARALIRQVQRKMSLLDSMAQINAQIAVANASFYLGQDDAVLRATREAVSVARTVRNTREVARTLNSLGLALMCVHDAEVEAIFDPLLEAVEKTGSWRFAQISHWFRAIYYAWKGDLTAALAACELQETIILGAHVDKPRLRAVQRHSKDLCCLLSESYVAITADFETTSLPKDLDIAYERLIDVAIAYALTGRLGECTDVLKRAKLVRASVPRHTLSSVRQSLIVEVIATCAVGQWSQAKRLFEQNYLPAPGLSSIEEALSLFYQGPPFVAVIPALERCLGKPYIGLIALLMKRVIETCRPETVVPLSTAEIEVLQLLVLGRSNKEIATSRSRSAETIKRQIGSIYKKLGVDNRTSAAAIAREQGLL